MIGLYRSMPRHHRKSDIEKKKKERESRVEASKDVQGD